MSQLKIGQVNCDKPGTRDAAHVPIACASSRETLNPGQRVKLDQSGRECCSVGGQDEYDGIVDPFVEKPIPANTPFYVFVKPSLVERFRHTFEIEGVYTPDPDDGDWNCQGCY